MERPRNERSENATEETAIKTKPTTERETAEDNSLSASTSSENKLPAIPAERVEQWVILAFVRHHSLDHLGIDMCSRRKGLLKLADSKNVLRKISEDRVAHVDNDKLTPVEKNALRRKRSLSLDPQILMHWAVSHNDVGTLKDLLECTNVDVNQPGVDGLYPLHRAASAGSFECLQYLVTKGAQLNVKDNQGTSPLDAAVCEGEFDCARFLIEKGADIAAIRDGFVDMDFRTSF